MNETYCMHCMERLGAEDETCVHCHQAREYQAPPHHIKPGTILKDKYLIGSALGEGGFGITYIGRDLTLDMRIAVKEYYPNGYSNRNHDYSNEVTLTQPGNGQDFERDMQRFLHEARMLAKFSDEAGIVGVRDFFRENKTAYIVMEYLDGVTLKSYIQKHGTVQPQKLFAMMDPVLLSLSHIHAQGLIHRDISPDNIMLLKNGQLKLLDFGAAREVGGEKSLSVMLKPGYAPEEQYRTKGNQGPWTDVYAMCATMYKCMTGVTPDESLERAYNDSLQPPSKLGAAISPAQEAALMKGLRVRVGERTQDIETLRQELLAERNPELTQSVDIQRQVEADETKTVYQPAEADETKTVYQPAEADETKTVYQPAEADETKTVYQPAEADEAKTVYQPSGADSAKTENGKNELAQANPNPEPKSALEAGAKEKKKQKNGGQKPEDPIPARKPKKRSRTPVCLAIGGAAVVLAVVLLLVFRFGGQKEQITAIPGDDFYSLKRVGQISDADRTVSISNDVISQQTQASDAGFYLLNCLGENIDDNLYRDAEYLGYGLYAAAAASGEVNSVALVNSAGEVLIPAEACLIEWPYVQDAGNCRYLVVYYATEEVSEGEDYFVCVDQYGSVYTSDVGGTLYDGYTRIFDLERKQFVGGTCSCTASSIQICGSSIVAGNHSIGYEMYDPDGNLLLQTTDSLYVGDGTLIIASGGTYRVYDETGTQTYSANKSISLIGKSQYIKMKSGEQYIAMDPSGNVVRQEAYDDITDESNGIFVVKNDGKYGLVTIDGTELAPCRYDAMNEIYRADIIGGGFFYGNLNGKYTLISPDGIVMTNLSASRSKLIQLKDNKALVINSRSYDLALGEETCDELTYALIGQRAALNGLYGVFDLFTGEQLLPQEYEMLRYAAGYLYAYKNETWEIYEVIFSQGS